jgi:hypothetical protein
MRIDLPLCSLKQLSAARANLFHASGVRLENCPHIHRQGLNGDTLTMSQAIAYSANLGQLRLSFK